MHVLSRPLSCTHSKWSPYSRAPVNPQHPRISGSNSNGRTTVSKSVACMASPRVVERVGSQIKKVLANLVLTDKVVQHAVLPESSFGADLYLSSVVTVTDVEMSRDLQVAKVFVSVFGDERGTEAAIDGVKSKAKYIRGQLGKCIKLRRTPEIRFIEDDSIEQQCRVGDNLLIKKRSTSTRSIRRREYTKLRKSKNKVQASAAMDALEREQVDLLQVSPSDDEGGEDYFFN